jgi:cobalamin biosynthesis protein CobW
LRSGGRTSILRTRQGAVDPRVALGLGATVQADLANRPTRHDAQDDHDHDDFESFVVDLAPASDPENLVALLSQVVAAHEVLRMKGFVEVAGKPMRLLVQGVGARFQHHYDRPWKAGEARASRLVVIGRKGLDREGIARRLSGR